MNTEKEDLYIINELKKKYTKIIKNKSINDEHKELIKNSIDQIIFTIDAFNYSSNQPVPPTLPDDKDKCEFIDARLSPVVLSLAMLYSMKLSDEYDNYHSLSELSDGT
tara:strand:+ start:276 stop:599 length:324 start_codon:yes stop_codon:yes gene_type:complete